MFLCGLSESARAEHVFDGDHGSGLDLFPFHRSGDHDVAIGQEAACGICAGRQLRGAPIPSAQLETGPPRLVCAGQRSIERALHHGLGLDARTLFLPQLDDPVGGANVFGELAPVHAQGFAQPVGVLACPGFPGTLGIELCDACCTGEFSPVRGGLVAWKEQYAVELIERQPQGVREARP